KISKSLGNVIDPNTLVEQYGADALRFYLFASTRFDQDGDFSRHDFVNKVNAELANNLGNLLNRTLTLLSRYCDGLVPDETPENQLREEANGIHAAIDGFMSRYEFSKAIEAVLALVDQANKYMNDEKPWSQFSNDQQAAGRVVLYTVLEILRRSAL